MKTLKAMLAIMFVLILGLSACNNPETENNVIYQTAPGNDKPKNNDLTWQDIYLDNVLSVAKIRIYQCTVTVNQPDPNCVYYGHGSGFVVADNVMATNWHVAEYYPLVNLEGLPDSLTYYRLYAQFPAHQTLNDNEFLLDMQEVQGVYDNLSQYDIALIKVNTLGRKPVKLSENRWEDAEILTEVMTMGFPLDFEFVATTGEITDILTNQDIDNDIYWIASDTKLYKTDAQIDGGNSGGPLFNKDGEVIGINFATYTTWVTTHNFGLSTDYIKLTDLDNLEFQTSEFHRPEDYVSTHLFSTKGELNPYWESESLYEFDARPGCIYKFTSFGDDFADDGSPINPAIVNLSLWVTNGDWTYMNPDYDFPRLTHLNYQPSTAGHAYLTIYINQSYQTDPGWYESWGWSSCLAE